MKVRSGFVSNSSSSSFIVIVKAPELSKEELVKLNTAIYTKSGGEEYAEESKSEIEALVDNDEHVIIMKRVEYGGEESVEEVAKELLKYFGVSDGVRFEWEG